MDHKVCQYQGLTFDDVLLEPRYSEVVPAEVDVATQLTARIRLNIPMLSSPMDTVTEAEMAIALAQVGGLGIIHKNMSIERQAEEVEKVKRSANGIIFNPATLQPDAKLAHAREIMNQYNVSGLPITAADGRLVGIITRRDLRFLEDWNLPISEVMTHENLVTATGTVTLEEAEKILMAKKVEKLLLVDEDFRLTGLITIKDIDMMRRFPQACKDGQGRLRAGAAVGVHDYERVEALIQKGVDVLVVDSAHGHSINVIETVRSIKKKWDIDVVAGNVATSDGCKDLIAAGADAVKVGIGPGSICTTRIISGVGVPQISAIYNAVQVAAKSQIPIIADGGIRYSGDLTKAIAAGAHVVMIGGLFAGLQESPGRRSYTRGERSKCTEAWVRWAPWCKAPASATVKALFAGQTNWCPRASRGECPSRDNLERSFINWSAGCERAWATVEQKQLRSCARKRDSSRSHQPVYGRVILMTSPSRRKRRTIARSMHPAIIRENRVAGVWPAGIAGRREACTTRWATALAVAVLVTWGSARCMAAVVRTGADTSIQQVSYSTGAGGSQLKWLPQRPDSPQSETSVTATQLTTPIRSRRVVRTAQNPTPAASGANDPMAAMVPSEPNLTDTLPGLPSDDVNSEKPKAGPRTFSPLVPSKPSNNNYMHRPLSDQEFSGQRELTEHCPSPKDLKPISELTTNITPTEGELPHDCPLGNATYQARNFAPITFAWTASGLCHKPLYFEDVQLERYGHMCGPWLQPFASGANFFLTIPILPYKMGLELPNECMFTLGYYRPGDCAHICSIQFRSACGRRCSREAHGSAACSPSPNTASAQGGAAATAGASRRFAFLGRTVWQMRPRHEGLSTKHLVVSA